MAQTQPGLFGQMLILNHHTSLVTRPGYFLVVAAVLHGVAGLVFNGEITAKTDGL